MLTGPKSLSIAKNHPKPSQEFSEQFGPSIHKMKGFGRNSPPKVHPNFAQNVGRQILGNTFSGLKIMLLRIVPEFFEDFSCLISSETETSKNSPKIPAIF